MVRSQHIQRRYPIGAELIPKKGCHFRIWAPEHSKAFVVIEKNSEQKEYPMVSEKNGYFSLLIPSVVANDCYGFRLGTHKEILPDPACRFQPKGSFGLSAVIDSKYAWTDERWRGKRLEECIIYEMHIGTFTKEGTFQAAKEHLKDLSHLGITLIELMPICECPGQFGWGYDGVNLFAPKHLYGTPSDLKAFINEAHRLKMGVILDVVYNHFGPEGNKIEKFTHRYFTKHSTDWGIGINFDVPETREFFLTNARYWIEEYHFDGLRLDAVWCFFCTTQPHILAEFAQTARNAGGERKILIIGEDESQNGKDLKPMEEGGYGFDALWNDDFHHTAHVALTGKREAYYTDYLGAPQEFISAIKYGFLYQGQYYEWQNKKRGTANLDISPSSLIVFLENHDQIANSGHGARLHKRSDPGNFKALTCLMLLSPNVPMLFQGQEFNSSKPFNYFSDHGEEFNLAIKESRKKELSQFPRLATPESQFLLPDPSEPLTFTKCKLDFQEREKNKKIYDLHKDLIELRKKDPLFKIASKLRIDGAVLSHSCFLLRYFGGEKGDRLLIFNFGTDLYLLPAPQPLLVAGDNKKWKILFSTEAPKYGGEGIPPIHIPYWKILSHSAIVLGSTN